MGNKDNFLLPFYLLQSQGMLGSCKPSCNIGASYSSSCAHRGTGSGGSGSSKRCSKKYGGSEESNRSGRMSGGGKPSQRALNSVASHVPPTSGGLPVA